MKFNEGFNKEYIMKAVHHCVDGAGCADCPYEFAPECASIEELLYYIKELMKENERLRLAFAAECDLSNCTREKEIKANTIRKMQERLKEYLDDFYATGEDALLDVPDFIDQIAKEMLEETNDRKRTLRRKQPKKDTVETIGYTDQSGLASAT